MGLYPCEKDLLFMKVVRRCFIRTRSFQNLYQKTKTTKENRTISTVEASGHWIFTLQNAIKVCFHS